MGDERDEIRLTLERLGAELEGLVVRGLRAVGPTELAALDGAAAGFQASGSEHLSGRLRALANAIRTSDRSAPSALFAAQTSLRVFERVFTLRSIEDQLTGALQRGPGAGAVGEGPEAATARSTESTAPPVDRKLLPVLDDLLRAAEELVSAGLTTASEATRQKLDASFKEAARLKLSRLAASLRYVNDELGRYLEDQEGFSAKRLSFFLNRAWLLTWGMRRAIEGDDRAALARLLLAPGAQVPMASLSLVVVGVAKREVKGSCSFDFRLRVVKAAAPLEVGQPLVWSCLFSRPKDDIPAEAYLHLPQPQKFNPKDLLVSSAITVAQASVALDERGGGRLLLGPQSAVTLGKPFGGWSRFHGWDLAKTRTRIQRHAPGPLDLEVELQEEVCLTQWEAGAPQPGSRPDQVVYPVSTPEGLTLNAVVTQGEGDELREALEGLRSAKKRPPLFGTVHYELGRFIFQPLAAFEAQGPRHLMISTEAINVRALMGTLKF